jgi:hypothetical protein
MVAVVLGAAPTLGKDTAMHARLDPVTSEGPIARLYEAYLATWKHGIRGMRDQTADVHARAHVARISEVKPSPFDGYRAFRATFADEKDVPVDGGPIPLDEAAFIVKDDQAWFLNYEFQTLDQDGYVQSRTDLAFCDLVYWDYLRNTYLTALDIDKAKRPDMAPIEAQLDKLAHSHCVRMATPFSRELLAGREADSLTKVEALVVLLTSHALSGGVRWLSAKDALPASKFRVRDGFHPAARVSKRSPTSWTLNGMVVIGEADVMELALTLDGGFRLDTTQWGWKLEPPRG